MREAVFPLGGGGLHLRLPDNADVYSMTAPRALAHPEEAIVEALSAPIGSPPLSIVAARAASRRALPSGGTAAKAVVVVSDNTRPVPYRGRSGILRPILEVLLAQGFDPRDVTVIVATGTHRAMSDDELRTMIDPWVFERRISVVNHDCREAGDLVNLGATARGSEVWIDRRYVESDLKILTGLVESHFMAGASGGRKAICPGLIGEKSTFIFHGAPFMAHPKASDLVFSGNPCHEEALEVANMAGADFILNVTLDHNFQITGVFAGDLEKAHEAAVSKIKSYVGIEVDGEYDVVVTHAGYVGINHYQAAKAAVAGHRMIREGGHLILVADNTDKVNPIGSLAYRTCLQLMMLVGAEGFERLLLSDSWTFIPDQWQVQQWCKVFKRLPMDHFVYFAPQLDARHWASLPGRNGAMFLDERIRERPSLGDVPVVIERAIASIVAGSVGGKFRIACLTDGPYGIPFVRGA